ncbi:MAG: hypothetical protein ABFR97_10415 [Thermodesulfobacteriota bacterium]
MRRTFLSRIACSLACGLSLGLSSQAMAEEEKPEADLTIGAYSQYVWRGWALSKDSLVIQPSTTISYKGFAFNLWGNLDTKQYNAGGNETHNFTETDMTISYDWSMASLDWGVGYIYYGLDGADDSQEFYLSLSKDILMAPALTIYRDTDSFPGWYVSAEIGHSFSLTEAIALDLGFKASYLLADDESTYADPSDSSSAFSNLFDGVLSVSATIPVNDYISVTPEMYYSFPLSSDASDMLEADNDGYNADENIFYGGISASLSF